MNLKLQKNHSLIYAVSLLVFGSMSGCLATTREYTDIKDEIYQLQMKLSEVQRNQADLSAKMDTLMSGMDALTSELEETQGSMSLLGQRLDDVEANLSRKMSTFSHVQNTTALTSSPTPSKIYQLAYSDFSRGKYDLAIVGLQSYLHEYPDGELAGPAHYYLGESYYAQKQWDKALTEFNTIETDFEQSDLRPAALLKQALCFEQIGKPDDVKRLLQRLIKEYPESPETYTAKEKIKSLPDNEQ